MTSTMSAAAVKRLRAEINQARVTPPPPLPDPFLHWLRNDYRPQPLVQPHWPTPLRDFVERTLELSPVRGEDSLRKHVTHLAYYGAWRLGRRDAALDPLTAMNRADVDEYARVGMTANTAKSRADRRSRLRAICDHLNPAAAPHRSAVKVPREALKPPYTAAQMTQISRAIQVQPTDERVRQLCLCVGLGAGAGIDSPELKLLDTSHIEDLGDEGIRVSVPGARARQVWVLRDYEALVRRGLRGLPPGRPLVGRVRTRCNVASSVYADATLLGSLPKLEQSRLRTTWLATLMTRPVPLSVLLCAAGLKSTRTLFDLLPHLPVTETAPETVLRDGAVR